MKRPAGPFKVIRRAEYANSLPVLKHVFLVGDLHQPAPHPFIRDKRVEFIVCRYGRGDHGDLHWHPDVTEYEIVISGEVAYFEAATRRKVLLKKGDFSVVPPGCCVQRLVFKGAQTIAVKVPSSAKKVHCAQCDRRCRSRMEPYREGKL